MVLAFIFNDVGIGEWFVLLAVILVVVGPRRLPEAARKFGRWTSKLRRAKDAFMRQLMELDQGVDDTFRRAETAVDSAFDDVADSSAPAPAPASESAPASEKRGETGAAEGN